LNGNNFMTRVKLADEGLVRLADATIADLEANRSSIEAGKGRRLERVNVATWFIPVVTHALKGGVRTIFMLSEWMSKRWGTLNVFVVYSHSGPDFDSALMCDSLRTYFPELRFVVRKFRRGIDTVEALPYADIAFCTLWSTAYLLLKYNKTSKKFYFMQDFEPLFYEAGSVYAAIEQTYRFGFSCIANTPGVGAKYRAYSDDVVSFYPGVDRAVYYARPMGLPSTGKRKVVFYGRPGNPRNCFSLGVMTLRALKNQMGSRVDIISVGADWSVDDYGLRGVVENRGLLSSLKDVADLYREADLGLVFMVTPHPSYQPFEYMACGCIVATNINEANQWLVNESNSIQLEPIPELAAQRIHEALTNEERMESLRTAGYATVEKYQWRSAFEVFEARVLGRTVTEVPSSAASARV
jgi:O-antigen biosynthesis protein